MIDQLPDSERRVALLLKERGHSHEVVMLPETGKTSAEAAAGLLFHRADRQVDPVPPSRCRRARDRERRESRG